MMLGVVLRWFAIWKLGRYFTRDVAVSSDQEVVQSGPYRFIRHPAYSWNILDDVRPWAGDDQLGELDRLTPVCISRPFQSG